LLSFPFAIFHQVLRYDSAMTDERPEPQEKTEKRKKKWVRKLLMVPLVAGIVIAGAAFGLPLIFATKKEPGEAPPEDTDPGQV
jgi:hypothetical protein